MQKHLLNNQYTLIGAALGAGAKIPETRFAPSHLKQMGIAEQLGIEWSKFLDTPPLINPSIEERLETVIHFNQDLCKVVQQTIKNQQIPLVIGGDHSIAIGTWSGVTTAHQTMGNFGLIWVDAHLDSHTYETSPSKAAHGMPVACLLGYGDKQLTSIGSSQPKLNPAHVVFIGARSYEKEEHDFLKKLNVNIFYKDDIKKHGLKTIVNQALDIVSHCSGGFGISIDLDAFDPLQVPGVGTPEPDGISTEDGLEAFKGMALHPQLKAIEIAELNPYLDKNNMSSQFAMDLLKCLFKK